MQQIKTGWNVFQQGGSKNLSYLQLFAPNHMARFQQQLILSAVSLFMCMPTLGIILYAYFKKECLEP
jgi:hypothetical protein